GFGDTSGLAAFGGPGRIIHLLQDDLQTNEYPAGFLDLVRIYNRVLTAAEAKAAFQGGIAAHAGEYTVPLAANQNVTGRDFDNQRIVVPPTHLKGIVFSDVNGDGTKQGTEAGIGNAVV